MMIHREKGFALLFGVHITPWHWYRDNFSRWFVIYLGPWRIETELVRRMESEP